MTDCNYPSDYQKNPSEKILEYIYRMCDNKCKYSLSWYQLADILNEVLGLNHTESWYRKNYKSGAFVEMFSDELQDTDEMNEEDNDEMSSLKEVLYQIKKERVKLRDENTQINALIRKASREESIKEIAHDFAVTMSAKKLLKPIIAKDDFKVGEKSAILQLSDWHYGIDVNSYWNVYNPSVARERVAKLLTETIRLIDENNVNEIFVVNLADLICGRIHLTLRLQSRIDVITQIMEVSEILAEFLTELRNTGCKVHYIGCLDNHSRLEPNKGDSIDFESLTRITDWYLRERLSGSVEFHNNEFSHDIITFKCRNYTIAGIHGDKDKPSDVVKHITMMTHQAYDLVLTAHLHHFSCDEQNETVVISNGSLMGTDDYAEKLRLSSVPSQNLIIVSDKSVCESIHRIILK